MRLKSVELAGFKSFVKKTQLQFGSAVTGIVGPNGSGKSNIAEAFRFCLGEQSMKSMRGRRGEDLIWNGSTSSPRAGRASVKLTFDNHDRGLNLDFDEVVIERVVHRDGVNDYLLNNSQVRLRDIAELLSQANIGGTGHHIISQGEADRALLASTRERREMLEDALGLTAYLYKREEAERKMAKTAENMREVASLRRELMPHIKFLAAQVKKIEEAKELRDTLVSAYAEYLKRESVYIAKVGQELADANEVPLAERAALDQRIAGLREELSGKKGGDRDTKELIALEARGRTARERKEAVTRELGRIEGELAAHTRLVAHQEGQVPAAETRAFATQVEQGLSEALSLEGAELTNRIKTLIAIAKDFVGRITALDVPAKEGEELAKRKRVLEKELCDIGNVEERMVVEVAALRRRIESEKDAANEAQRELFEAMARRGELEAQLVGLRAKGEMLARDQAAFKAEFTEAGVLLGREILEYESYRISAAGGEEVGTAEIMEESRTKQEGRRRALERMKIKLEGLGAGGGAEVLKEYQDTTKRDQFLARELADLETSSEKLHALIGNLTDTLETRFVEGIKKINREFDAFFKLMFGGGSATLSVVKEKRLRKGSTLGSLDVRSNLNDDEEDVAVEEGVDIAVNLPHKRLKGLNALSGGERALTSIALIFAMSQVNPPPFLILDETDAALDEANSRRYGDMIENLAKKSQLILITHNRETMSRAGVLYGITMGTDGASKLLSVKFEEALAVAK
ncbi:AAA family ATPase [Patescibacteria group bacterium]|nr:AAA family ATPase [Patescibacteria group bacterium]